MAFPKNDRTEHSIRLGMVFNKIMDDVGKNPSHYYDDNNIEIPNRRIIQEDICYWEQWLCDKHNEICAREEAKKEVEKNKAVSDDPLGKHITNDTRKEKAE